MNVRFERGASHLLDSQRRLSPHNLNQHLLKMTFHQAQHPTQRITPWVIIGNKLAAFDVRIKNMLTPELHLEWLWLINRRTPPRWRSLGYWETFIRKKPPVEVQVHAQAKGVVNTSLRNGSRTANQWVRDQWETCGWERSRIKTSIPSKRKCAAKKHIAQATSHIPCNYTSSRISSLVSISFECRMYKTIKTGYELLRNGLYCIYNTPGDLVLINSYHYLYCSLPICRKDIFENNAFEGQKKTPFHQRKLIDKCPHMKTCALYFTW